MARVIPPSERYPARGRTARTNEEVEQQPDRGLPETYPEPGWDNTALSPVQAGVFAGGNLPLLLGAVGLLAGGAYFLISRD